VEKRYFWPHNLAEHLWTQSPDRVVIFYNHSPDRVYIRAPDTPD